MIIIFKPFSIVDFIDAQGCKGVVSKIQIFNTYLKTTDNKTIIIPNGESPTLSMRNYCVEKFRSVEFSFGVGYEDGAEKQTKF
jgi:small conductance mechanosensitive channel